MNTVKIIATIGPKTASARALRELRAAGMDIARLNGSHADGDWHRTVISLIRKTLPEVPILFDIPGKKIRVGVLDEQSALEVGEHVVFSSGAKNGRTVIPVTYSDLHQDVRIGDEINIDDTPLSLVVTGVSGDEIACEVKTAGVLQTGKGVHLPGVAINSNFLSQRDIDLIGFARETGVDFVGMSFVESASNVEVLRTLLGKGGPKIVSKIETQPGLDHLDEVIGATDALMIDRGDLSAETHFERVALFQKTIIERARKRACPVIVATDMLSSMIENPTPFKAEISDITNAVLDGASVLMLSGETAVGAYPAESVSVMRRVADVASSQFAEDDQDDEDLSVQVPDAIGEAIALLCRRLKITKIVAVTVSGYAARMLSLKMPKQPVLAVSNDLEASRRFNVYRGVKGIHLDIPFHKNSMAHLPKCLEALWHSGEIAEDDLVLVTAVGYPKSGNRMNLIETHKISDLVESLGWSKPKPKNRRKRSRSRVDDTAWTTP